MNNNVSDLFCGPLYAFLGAVKVITEVHLVQFTIEEKHVLFGQLIF